MKGLAAATLCLALACTPRENDHAGMSSIHSSLISLIKSQRDSLARNLGSGSIGKPHVDERGTLSAIDCAASLDEGVAYDVASTSAKVLILDEAQRRGSLVKSLGNPEKAVYSADYGTVVCVKLKADAVEPINNANVY